MSHFQFKKVFLTKKGEREFFHYLGSFSFLPCILHYTTHVTILYAALYYKYIHLYYIWGGKGTKGDRKGDNFMHEILFHFKIRRQLAFCQKKRCIWIISITTTTTPPEVAARKFFLEKFHGTFFLKDGSIAVLQSDGKQRKSWTWLWKEIFGF